VDRARGCGALLSGVPRVDPKRRETPASGGGSAGAWGGRTIPVNHRSLHVISKKKKEEVPLGEARWGRTISGTPHSRERVSEDFAGKLHGEPQKQRGFSRRG